MTKFKTLSAIVVLSAVIATPVLAQDANVTAPARATTHQNFRGAYNQSNGSFYAAPRAESGRNTDFGSSAMDRSFPGGHDPSLNPAGD